MAIALKFTRYPPDHSIPERRGMPNYEIFMGVGGIGSRGRVWVLKGYVYKMELPKTEATRFVVNPIWVAVKLDQPFSPIVASTFEGIKDQVRRAIKDPFSTSRTRMRRR